MAYRAGDETVEKELWKLQRKAENWSDDLDGENGMIRQFREDRAERRGAVKLLQGVGILLSLVTLIQVVLEIVRAVHHI